MPIYLLLLFLALFPLRNLINPGLPITHDLEQHLARLASFSVSFAEGNLYPRWAGNLNYGFGHPNLMFQHPLINYLSLPIHYLGFTFADSVKLLIIISYILSGLFMYLFLRLHFSRLAALFGTVVYLYIPYRFVDIYVRGAVPEQLFFALAPLTLYFVFLFCSQRKIIYLFLSIQSLALLLLSHIANGFFFLPFIIFLLIIFGKNNDFWDFVRRHTMIVLIIITSLSLTAFYWFPAIYEGKYTLRHLILNKDEAVKHRVSLQDLFNPSWNYGYSGSADHLSFQLGAFSIILILFSVYALFKVPKKEKLQKAVKYLLLLTVIFSFFMTDYSRWVWLNLPLLYNIRFPWRLLVFISLIIPLISSWGVSVLPYIIKSKLIRRTLLFLYIFLIILTSAGYQQAQRYYQLTDKYLRHDYNYTADNGESSPIWGTFSEEKKPNSQLEVLAGDMNFRELKRLSNRHH